MLSDFRRYAEVHRFLHGNLFGVAAHHEMDFVRGKIDLIKQALEKRG